MTEKENADKLANELKYDYAEEKQKWNGFNVYICRREDQKKQKNGYPIIILGKNGQVRLATPKECVAWLWS